MIQIRRFASQIRLFVAAMVCLICAAAAADDGSVGIVSKQVFTTQNFETFNGARIAEVNVGWEAYGQLNERKDNVVLITQQPCRRSL